MVEVFQLSEAQRNRLFQVVARLSKALKSITGAHKINIDSIGNVVAQLHVHLIARTTDDPLWPNPIWRQPANGDRWWPQAPAPFIADLEAHLLKHE
jgi:diadenosine tetraphosphate (Ap4A) HIT family hydrolase